MKFHSIVQRFNAKRVKYAGAGGIALPFYTEQRFTKGIEILTILTEIDKFKVILIELDFDEAFMHFSKKQIELFRLVKIEKENYLLVDILVRKEDWHFEVVSTPR